MHPSRRGDPPRGLLQTFTRIMQEGSNVDATDSAGSMLLELNNSSEQFRESPNGHRAFDSNIEGWVQLARGSKSAAMRAQVADA